MEAHGCVDEAAQEVSASTHFRKPQLLEFLVGLDVPARLPKHHPLAKLFIHLGDVNHG